MRNIYNIGDKVQTTIDSIDGSEYTATIINKFRSTHPYRNTEELFTWYTLEGVNNDGVKVVVTTSDIR